MSYEENVIRKLRAALAEIRAEANKSKPDPDKIFEIAETIIRDTAS